MPDTGDTEAYIAITRLQSAYADVITRRAWAELDALFVPGAPIHVDTVSNPVIELVGADALGAFVDEAIARFDFFEFVILSTVVDVVDESSARGRLYMVELRQDAASGEWSNAFGVYQDAYVVHDGRWRFAERHYQSLARKTGTERAPVFPFPETMEIRR